jgi:putative GTP pyrophosphokinase
MSFDYQSLHYIVRSRIPFDHQGLAIPAALPCEIQIRTLLQHAYSELTHDTIYKPSVKATPSLKRAAAKSMALIEATGDYFSEVNTVIQRELASARELATLLEERYTTSIGPSSGDTPLNSLILDHYRTFTAPDFKQPFDEWFNAKSYVADRIKERAPGLALYRVPSILLVYYAVSTTPRLAAENSPLSDDELGLIYSDVGHALHG